jgi:replicative superfamily II helicase
MNVIVTAPTGASKTAVGIMALYNHHHHHHHHHTTTLKQQQAEAVAGTFIYTTPLKALSNQKFKFVELKQIFGIQNAGLSTGDIRHVLLLLLILILLLLLLLLLFLLYHHIHRRRQIQERRKN